MKNILSSVNRDVYYKIIFFAFIFCLVLVPPFHLPWFRFKFQVTDLFMPVFIGMIYVNKWYKNWSLFYVKNLVFLSLIILISIIINKQWFVINDYFEIYRVLTCILVFIVFKEIYSPKITSFMVDVIFILLLIFNFLHYHNIFDFNQTIMPVYCGADNIQLTHFGLNSLGLPAVKRMIGTMANPNDNAVLFLIFMLFYLPKERWKKKDICFFVLCMIAFLACQSRTSLVAFFGIITANFLIINLKWQKTLVYSGLIIGVMLGFFLIDIPNNYSLTLLDGSALESYSWTYRLELWKQFLSQSLDHPFLGHAPQKNYFYEHKLHFENESVLFLWRYGILGFISLIGFYLIPVKKIFKTMRSSEISKNTLLLIMIFAICGLANVPLSNTILSLLFFSYLGIFYSQKTPNIIES